MGPDARVGLCVERGLEMMVGLLGVLKAGGAYVPLDPTYPMERLKYMVADSDPVMVLQHGEWEGSEELFEELTVPVVELGSTEWATNEEEDPPRGALMPDHLAYVMYTSGSTGRPKGVWSPRGVVNFLDTFGEGLDVQKVDSVLATTTLAFDISITELLLPLAAAPGGR